MVSFQPKRRVRTGSSSWPPAAVQSWRLQAAKLGGGCATSPGHGCRPAGSASEAESPPSQAIAGRRGGLVAMCHACSACTFSASHFRSSGMTDGTPLASTIASAVRPAGGWGAALSLMGCSAMRRGHCTEITCAS